MTFPTMTSPAKGRKKGRNRKPILSFVAAGLGRFIDVLPSAQALGYFRLARRLGSSPAFLERANSVSTSFGTKNSVMAMNAEAASDWPFAADLNFKPL
jgi:hypothetical protein